MTDILVGAKIKAADFPASMSAGDGTTLTALANTTYARGTPEVGTTFVAPTSGRILLTVAGGMRDGSQLNRVHIAPEIYIGTNALGTRILAADVTSRGVGSPAESAGFIYYSRTTLYSGLTPGTTYYAVVAYKVSGGNTSQIAYRQITVEPTT
ncbi:hypothetical protein [Sphaerisporangium rhizosphaerae]|uniref:Fibronectin type-III domain-containing protein n=1 Tax=Sphaerisporangium rhizosphaerae TaxID=2269375 RepID=A0ABW2NWG9_9ACTN